MQIAFGYFSVCNLKGKEIAFRPHLLLQSNSVQHEKASLSAAGRAKEGSGMETKCLLPLAS